MLCRGQEGVRPAAARQASGLAPRIRLRFACESRARVSQSDPLLLHHPSRRKSNWWRTCWSASALGLIWPRKTRMKGAVDQLSENQKNQRRRGLKLVSAGFYMNPCRPSQWVTRCAERLHERWQTVESAQLEEVAMELWRDSHLCALPPEKAATLWLSPLASQQE